MEFTKINNHTRVFGPPGDMGGYCGSLHIRDEHVTNHDPETGEKQDFGNFMVSAWKPSEMEIEALRLGVPVLLHIRGTTHPVVMVTVGQ